MKVLVVGDFISDLYRFCEPIGLCPEAPVIKVRETKCQVLPGGAGLVTEQLIALLGAENVNCLYGSRSVKERIFVDGHLMSPRIDNDSTSIEKDYENRVVNILQSQKPKVLVVSDYSKGAFTEAGSHTITAAATELGIPVLVDAKNTWDWWMDRVTAVFPNERESVPPAIHSHVIRKLGAKGCSVNGISVPLEETHQVMDVTGAGDCFLAAFATALLNLPRIIYENGGRLSDNELIICARFANKVAARSVEFVGTHVVDDIKL